MRPKTTKPVIKDIPEALMERQSAHSAWRLATRQLKVGQGLEAGKPQIMACWREAKKLGFEVSLRSVNNGTYQIRRNK